MLTPSQIAVESGDRLCGGRTPARVPASPSVHRCGPSPLSYVQATLTCAPPDNAVMIAWAAMHRFARQDFDPPHDVLTKAKWTLDEFSGECLRPALAAAPDADETRCSVVRGRRAAASGRRRRGGEIGIVARRGRCGRAADGSDEPIMPRGL